MNELIAQAQQTVQQTQQALPGSLPQAAEQLNQAAQQAQEPGMLDFLVYFFKAGGFWMLPIALAMAWAIVVTIERFIRVFQVYSIDADSFFSKIQKNIIEDSVDRAINLCNGKSSALLPGVLKAGLIHAKGSEQEIQSAVEEAALEALPLVEKRAMYLPLISNVATLLGLLGTIIGLIQAFASISTAAPDQRAAALSQAIAVAMHTTAFGLVVAIPAMVCHTLIQSRANRILADIDHYGMKLVNLLVMSKR